MTVLPELLRALDQRSIGFGSELGPNDLSMDRHERQRPFSISDCGERVDVSQRAAGAQGVGFGSFSPPTNGASKVAGRRRRPGELFQDFQMSVGEPSAFVARPALELSRFPEEETVEERSRVQALGNGVLLGCDRVVKFSNVAADDGRIETQLGCADDGIVPKHPTHAEQQIVQRVPRLVGSALGPEVGEHFVALQATRPRACEEHEERNRFALAGESRERLPVG